MKIRSWFRRLFIKKNKKEKITFKPVLIDGKFVDVSIDELTGMTERERKLFIESGKLICDIANSEDFRYEVTRHNFTFEHDLGMSKKDIYFNFMSGKTALDRSEDRILNVDYNLYYTVRNTIGYVITNDRDDEINFNKKYLSYNDEGKALIVGNYFHEDRHNAGFSHEKTGYSQYNVPYFYGNSARKLAIQVLDGRRVLTPLRSIF